MKQGNTRLARLLLRIAGITNVLMFFTLCCEAAAFGGGFLALMLLPLGFAVFAVLYANSQRLWFELAKERTFKHACIGIGMKGEVPSWKYGLQGRMRGDTKIITPQLRDVHGTHEEWAGTVRFFDGQTIDEFNKKADAFALAFGVPFVTFDLAPSGLIAIRAGNVAIPDAYSHPGPLQTLQAAVNKPMSKQVLTIDEIPPSVLKAAEQFSQRHGYGQLMNEWEHERSLLKGVPMARDLNGRECKIPIEGQHWFIAARTGSGKGSWIWSLVLGLEPAWRSNLVKFWGIDPKMIELSIGRDWFDYYADDDESSVLLLEECVKQMNERLRHMQGISRKFTPTVETPLNVVVVDEMGYLSTYMADKKLRERADKAIATILSKGRAPGFAFVGALQDPRKEVCGYRDLFSIRIAGSLPAPMVDLVLGEGMRDANALCDQIPIGNAGAGVAYVLNETTMKPICVRAAWCDDEAIQQALVEPARTAIDATLGKDGTLSGQVDWKGQPFGQFRCRTE